MNRNDPMRSVADTAKIYKLIFTGSFRHPDLLKKQHYSSYWLHISNIVSVCNI